MTGDVEVGAGVGVGLLAGVVQMSSTLPNEKALQIVDLQGFFESGGEEGI